MQYEDVVGALLSEFPAVEVDEDEYELPYVVAGWFTNFILKAFKNGDRETYLSGLDFIERLHLSDTHRVRELATVGFLESIQNTWSRELLDADIPFNDLGEESKKWWIKLNRLWNGDINALRYDE